MLSAGSFVHLLSAPTAGWLTNRLGRSTPALVFAMFAACAMCVALLLVECARGSLRVALLFAIQIFIGRKRRSFGRLQAAGDARCLLFTVALGLMSVCKAQFVASSTEADRGRAIALNALVVSLGMAIGPSEALRPRPRLSDF